VKMVMKFLVIALLTVCSLSGLWGLAVCLFGDEYRLFGLMIFLSAVGQWVYLIGWHRRRRRAINGVPNATASSVPADRTLRSP